MNSTIPYPVWSSPLVAITSPHSPHSTIVCTLLSSTLIQFWQQQRHSIVQHPTSPIHLWVPQHYTISAHLVSFSLPPVAHHPTHPFSYLGYRNSDPFVYKPLEDVVLAYDGDGSVTFSLIAACIGFNLFFCQIYYVPPGSQLQRNDHLDSYGVNTLKGPVSVNDNGTVIQCWLTCGSFEEPRSIPYNSTLVVLGNY